MDQLLVTFQAVCLIFAMLAILTGGQALLAPVSFSESFGLPITTVADHPDISISTVHGTTYVSLMGIRQLAMGVILLAFAYQGKWTENAVILSIIGVLQAGTDGLFLWRSGKRKQARFHAIPGLLIALLGASIAVRKI